MVATKPDVNGTVLSQSKPMATENNKTLGVEMGTNIKAAIVTERKL